MDMAERPVVHARGAQVVERRRCVRVVAGRAADVGVQNADGDRVARLAHVAQREVLEFCRSREAAAVDGGDHFAVDFDLEPADAVGREHVHALRQREPGRPAVGRVVVAVHDEDLDTRLGQPTHPRLEVQLCRQARVRRVVRVAGDDQEACLALETDVDDPIERREGRLRQRGADAGVLGAHAAERRPEMQVCGMDEPDAITQRCTPRFGAVGASPGAPAILDQCADTRPRTARAGAARHRRAGRHGRVLRWGYPFAFRFLGASCPQSSKRGAPACFERDSLMRNISAGVVVGVVALPLAMAFAIASGAKPEQGLYTALVAGLLVTLLGGTRVQIAGPTGAFAVLLFGVTARYGLAGLQIVTLLAGAMLLLLGLAKLGGVIRFIPESVVLGFTAGIAIVIFVGQWGNFFGLPEAAGATLFEKLPQLLALARTPAAGHHRSSASRAC